MRAAAEADAALRPQLRAELSAVDEAEQQKLKAPQEEVYVGFHELDQSWSCTRDQPTVGQMMQPVCGSHGL